MRWAMFYAAAVLHAAAHPVSAQASADSLVLERTECFGTCPAYRLAITRSGAVHFESRNPGDSTVAKDQMSSSVLIKILERASSIGFEKYPPRIAADRRLCEDRATDHPTAIVTIFAPKRVDRVEDYWGCMHAADHSLNEPLTALRTFEASIDRAVGSARWVKPARRRR